MLPEVAFFMSAAVVAETARDVADTTVAADRALPGASKSSVHRVLIPDGSALSDANKLDRGRSAIVSVPVYVARCSRSPCLYFCSCC